MQIHIIGSVCSGKTTIAQKLSKDLNLEYTEIDGLLYDSKHLKNSQSEISEKMHALIKQKNRITDCCFIQENQIKKLIQNTDKIYILKINFLTNIWQVIKRNNHYKKAKKPESLSHFVKMIKQVVTRKNIYKEYYQQLNELNVKYIQVRSIKDITEDIKK